MAYFMWPWCLLGDYLAQAIKECIHYELTSAYNPYVRTNFCKLLSLTYYTFHHYKVLIFKRRLLWKHMLPSLFLRLFMLELSHSKAGHSKENYKKSVRKNVFFSFLGSVSQKGLKLLPCFKKPRNVPCIWTKKDILKIAEGCVRCKCSIILIWIIYQELIVMKLLFFKLLFDLTNLMNYYPQVDLMVKIYCFLP